MNRIVTVAAVLVLALGACSDDDAEPTTSTAPPTTTTTTAPAGPTTTTTVAGGTTTTSSLPQSEPNPELEALRGIWTSETINSWSIRFDGYTIVAGGNPTNLVIPGSVDLEDGVLTVRGLDLGLGGCGEAAGRYTVARDGNSLIVELIDDECTQRAESMPGLYAFVE